MAIANTTNLGLRRPDYDESADVAAFNTNAQILDEKIGPVGNTSVQEQINTMNSGLAKVAQIITGSTNNSGMAIAAGDYFIANGALYMATASIPSGSAWSSSAQAIGQPSIINVLNSKITNLGLVQNATLSVGTGEAKYCKIGNIVVGYVKITPSTDMQAMFASGFPYPAMANIMFVGAEQHGTIGNPVVCRIDSENLYAVSLLSANKTYVFSFSYVSG